jgi:endonuclease G
MDRGYQQVPQPNRRGQIIWLWVLFILLVVLVGCLAYFLIQGVTERAGTAPAEPPVATAGLWGDRYCYAGAPRATTSFPDQITVLTNTGYLVGYCERRKDPVWVCYRLFKPDQWSAPPRPQEFRTDYRTAARANTHDYSGSGYDRGHMAPNYAIAVCYGPQAQLETFLMSNIIPQRPALNRQVWERLEQSEIRDYAPRYRQIWVIDGPVFHRPDRLRGGEDIPDACYKIIVREDDGHPSILAFIMPQTVRGTEPPSQFLSSVHEIEQETGLDFFSGMPPEVQKQLEAKTAVGMW